jgi:hypothetical protein
MLHQNGQATMPKRKFSSRERKTKVRDARLVIIATEGEYTEKQYFQALAEHYRNSKIHVEILHTEDKKSAPNHVIERLNGFVKQYSLERNDELWLVVDVDRWTEKLLSEIAKTCLDKNYLLAVSNPCFELWLLLHIATWNDYSEDQLKMFFENVKDGSRIPIELEIIRIVGEHNKSNLKTIQYTPHVETAIEQAKALDINPNDRWTQTIGTRVYRVAESIIKTKRR